MVRPLLSVSFCAARSRPSLPRYHPSLPRPSVITQRPSGQHRCHASPRSSCLSSAFTTPRGINTSPSRHCISSGHPSAPADPVLLSTPGEPGFVCSGFLEGKSGVRVDWVLFVEVFIQPARAAWLGPSFRRAVCGIVTHRGPFLPVTHRLPGNQN